MGRHRSVCLSPQELRAIKRREFIRGSAVAVAAHMAAWSDDNEMLAFADMVRCKIVGTKPNPAAVKIVMDALCEKYEIEPQGNRELIEAAYEPTLRRGRPREDSQ